MKSALVAAVVLLVACFGHPAAAATPGTWTVLVYLDADNDLENSGMFNMHEMESVGPAAGVRILVQMDRAPGYDDTDGDWQGAHRYEIVKDATRSADKLRSPVLQDLGEVDMSDPATLREFLEWGVQTAPAAHYYVILWDHGAAWDGVLADETTGPDALMPLASVTQALAEARTTSGVAAWDVVHMDACLMASAEAVHAVANDASILVASEELVPGQGLPYPELLGTLKASPAILPKDLAKSVLSAYATRYSGSDAAIPRDPDAVLSSMDLQKEAAFTAALATFSGAIAQSATTHWQDIVRDAKASERFKKPDQQNSNDIDVADLAARLAASSASDASLKTAANAVVSAKNALVTGATTSPNHPHATGITMQLDLPSVGGDPSADTGGATSPTAAASRAIATAASTDKLDPVVADFALDSSSSFDARAPLGFHATAADPNLGTIEAAVSAQRDDGEAILLYLEPSSVTWTNDDTLANATWSWSGRGTALTNGATTAIVPAYSAGPDGGFLLDGNYTRSGAAPSTPFEAVLEFDAAGVLTHAWDVAGAASEIQPRAGDAFSPTITVFDEQGDASDKLLPAIAATKDGPAAWRLTNASLPPGDYAISIYAEDLAGNANLTDPVEVTLDAASAPTPTTMTTSTTTTSTTTTTTSTTTTPSLEDNGPTKGTPGLGVVSVLALAAALAVLVRRRR